MSWEHISKEKKLAGKARAKVRFICPLYDLPAKGGPELLRNKGSFGEPRWFWQCPICGGLHKDDDNPPLIK